MTSGINKSTIYSLIRPQMFNKPLSLSPCEIKLYFFPVHNLAFIIDDIAINFLSLWLRSVIKI